MKTLSYCSLALLCVLFVGCGDGGPERHHISGTATFDGEPISYGEVYFYPDSGPEGYAVIREGMYTTENEEGKAIVEGPHRVRVTAYSFEPFGIVEDETVEADPATTPELLFVNYELKSDLSGTSFDIQVPAEAKGANGGAASKPAKYEP